MQILNECQTNSFFSVNLQLFDNAPFLNREDIPPTIRLVRGDNNLNK